MQKPTKLLDMRGLSEVMHLGRSAIYARLDPKSPYYDASFPKQIQIGLKAVRWSENEIQDWISSKMITRC